ncbi:coenzyme A transporter [Spiromyces aspiralis]|uniref:Coenzyme A transporter n=1 Tax=Spiromyces aspiralis TaxID=68401 RepID=A0ACC1HNM8_9FUNG|nr:coenzyme A transporter [Spiromyces aspiralis]
MVKLEQQQQQHTSPTIKGAHKSVDGIKIFIIGGLAGCLGKTTVAPLDRVKILFQTNNPEYISLYRQRFGMLKAARSIYLSRGAMGLFQGHSMQLARIYPYAAIKFLCFEKYLQIIRVRMAYSTPHGQSKASRIRDVIHMISSENTGHLRLFNFYRGFSLSLLGMVPYAGVSFLTHNFIVGLFRHHMPTFAVIKRSQDVVATRRRKKPELRAWAEIIAGGISGVIAQTASYPFELLRRRQQVSGISNPTKFVRSIDIIRDIWAKQGLRGFFVGITVGYIKVFPMFAVTFYSYEKLKTLFDIEEL